MVENWSISISPPTIPYESNTNVRLELLGIINLEKVIFSAIELKVIEPYSFTSIFVSVTYF